MKGNLKSKEMTVRLIEVDRGNARGQRGRLQPRLPSTWRERLRTSRRTVVRNRALRRSETTSRNFCSLAWSNLQLCCDGGRELFSGRGPSHS
jgi:hypothetical protein